MNARQRCADRLLLPEKEAPFSADTVQSIDGKTSMYADELSYVVKVGLMMQRDP
jgi:hypothetical protein